MKEKICAIVLAGGQGKRMNSSIPKQYMEIDGYPVLYYSLKELEQSEVEEIILVVGRGEIEYVQKNIVEKYAFQKIMKIVSGGKERYESVYHGLQEIEDDGYVLIHDGARPLLSQDIIKKGIEEVKQCGACVIGMPVKDTIKIVDEKQYVKDTPNRRYLWLVQTPQIFKIKDIKKAYEKMWKIGDDEVTDDAMVMEKYGCLNVKLVEGAYQNIKVTTPEDILIASLLLNHKNI